MKSHTTDQFWDIFRTLPQHIRKQAQEAHRQFDRDTSYPGLNFEEVDARRHLWSARVTRGYRVLGIREGDDITWFWIGSHSAYDKLIKGH